MKVGRQKQKLMRLTNQQFCVQHKKLSFNWEQLSLSNKQQVGLAMVLQVTQLFLKSLLVYKANKSIQNSRSSFHLCQLQLKTCKISISIGSTLIRALVITDYQLIALEMKYPYQIPLFKRKDTYFICLWKKKFTQYIICIIFYLQTHYVAATAAPK